MKPAERRDAWLFVQCNGDDALLAELRSLLTRSLHGATRPPSEGIELLRDPAALREHFLGSDDPRTHGAHALLAKVDAH